MGIGLAVLPTLLIFMLALIPCVITLYRGLVLPARMPRNAACGSCGHEIDFSRPICPECGADLRRVGTMTARGVLLARSNTVVLIIVWTLLFILAAPCAMAPMAMLSASQRMAVVGGFHGTYTQTFQPVRTWDPETGNRGKLYSIEVTGGTTADGVMTVRVKPADGPRVSVEIDKVSVEWTLQSEGEPITGTGIDEGAARTFLEAAGIDLSPPDGTEEVADLVRILEVGVETPESAQELEWGLTPVRPAPPPLFASYYTGSTSSSGNTSEVELYPTGGVRSPNLTLTFDANVHSDAFAPNTPSEVELELDADVGWPVVLTLDLNARRWAVTRQDTTIEEGAFPLDRVAAGRILEQLGETERPDSLADELVEMVALASSDRTRFVESAVQNLLGSVSYEAPTGLQAGGGTWNASGPMPVAPGATVNPMLIATIAMGAVAFLAWVSGILFIVMRRRRLLRVPEVAA